MSKWPGDGLLDCSPSGPCGEVVYKRKDYYHQRAKQLDYRSRAAFKLIELNRRLRLLKPGDYVVDLGAWPGGWLQVTAEMVGGKGKVVGVDLVPLKPLAEANITIVHADVADPQLSQRVLHLLGRPADVLLSDMAPKLSGIPPTDSARALALAELSMSVSRVILRPGGSYLCKLFTGPEAESFFRETVPSFKTVRLCRPSATRRSSSEIYLFGGGFRKPRNQEDERKDKDE